MKANAPNRAAPASALNTSSTVTVTGDRLPIKLMRKSLRVMRPLHTAAASCRNTMEATERAENSATPVMGRFRKSRPMTSATTRHMIAKIHTVPTEASRLAGVSSG